MTEKQLIVIRDSFANLVDLVKMIETLQNRTDELLQTIERLSVEREELKTKLQEVTEQLEKKVIESTSAR